MSPIRTYNTKRNLLFGGVNKGASILLPYLVRVIMMHTMGVQYLGLDNLFFSVLQVLNLTELGFSNAVMYSMYKPIAEGDNHTLCAIYSYYKRVYQVVGLVVLGCGLILMPFLPHLIRGEYPAHTNLYYLYLIHLINTSISYLLFAYKQTLLSANQRQDIVSNINTVARTIMYLLQIIVLAAWRDFYAYTIMMLVMTILMNLGTSVAAKRLFPEVVCEGVIDNSIREDIITRVKGVMLSRLSAISRNAFDSIFVSTFIGLTATAIYNNYYYVIHAINGVFAVFTTSIAAGVGNSVAEESKEKNYRDMIKLNYVYMWLSGVAAVCMLCSYQGFIRRSFGTESLLPTSAMMLFVIYFYCLKLGDVFSVYYQGAGIWWEGRYRAITEAAANLILNYILGKRYGIYGIIIATLVSLFIINFLWGSNIIFKHYFTQTTSLEYFKLHGFYAVVTLVACLATYWITSFVTLDGIIGMVVVIGICIVIPNIIYMGIYRHTKIYKESIGWLGRVTGWEKYSVWKVFGKLS